MVSSLGDALQADFGQKHGEGDVVVVQHTSGHSVKGHLHPQEKSQCEGTLNLHHRKFLQMFGPNLEEIFSDGGQPLRMVTDVLEVGVLIQYCVVSVQEKVERVLIQEVHLELKENGGICFYQASTICK